MIKNTVLRVDLMQKGASLWKEVSRIDREDATFRTKSYLEHRSTLITLRGKMQKSASMDTRNDLYTMWRQFLLQQKRNTLYQNRLLSRTSNKLLLAENTRAQFWIWYEQEPIMRKSLEDKSQDTASACSISENAANENGEEDDDEDDEFDKRDHYLFVPGMHNIFVGCDSGEGIVFCFVFHLKKVNRIKFAYNDNDLLGFATSEGNIIISTARYEYKILQRLKGHQGLVNGKIFIGWLT